MGQQHVLTLRRVAKRRTSNLDREDARAPVAVHLPHMGGELRTVTGDSPVRRMMRDIRRMAMSAALVTIVGPSGPVRSEIARALHRAWPRREGPFLVVACATVVEGLSELFGHVEGAFTGAHKDQKGLFEAADGGTLVLEGLEDLAPRHQAALLRTLETSRVRRAGSNAEVPVDVRVVATRSVRGHGRIRDDLRHRLEVLVLQTSSVGR